MKVTRILSLFLAAATVAIFVGCNKNNDDRSSRDGNPYTGNASLPPTGSAYYQSVEIYVSGTEAAAKNFLAPMVAGNLSKIGTISSNGVKMMAYVVVNRANNQIVPQSSFVQFEITDSFVGTTGSGGQVLPPFNTGRIYAQGGTVSGSSVDITFGDSVGTVRVLGALNSTTAYSSNLTARVDFSNNAPYQSSGTLGQITVPTCGFFDCGK